MSKRVMLALTPAGGGHAAVARAVSQALSVLAPDVAVSEVNVFSPEYAYFPLTAIPRAYARLTTEMPAVWRGLFRATDGLAYTPVERLAQPIMRPALRAALEAALPDVIVSLNPALGNTMQCAVRDLGWHIPLGVVISDLVSIHPAWFCRGAAWHAVPSEEAWWACRAAGIDPATIHLTGQPVGLDFCQEVADRPALRRSLGLPTEEPVVLIAGGGEGVGSVEETVSALLASGLSCHLVVITGRNERLRQRLAHRAAGSHVHVLGFVTNMADWMHAADLLITKAGPNTIMEAVHCGLPLILTGAIPGQEEANLDYVRSRGLGIVATQPAEVVAAVKEMLGNPERAAHFKRAMQKVRRPDAALRVARLILDSQVDRISPLCYPISD